MTRTEFMNELEQLLFDLSKDERDEALQYYNDYFNDAGKENEDEILKKLESPQKVAQTIRSGLYDEMDDKREYSETGYHYAPFEDKNLPSQTIKKKPWTNKTLKWLLVILILVIGLPIVLPVATTALGIVLAIVIAIFAILSLLLGGGFIVAAVGVVLFVFACLLLPGSFISSLGFLGSALIFIALGLSVSVLLWWCALKLFPPVFRWLVELIRKLFHRKEN